MLRIYFVALEMCRDAARIAKLIEKHDTSLANQLRRCVSSVPLNIREGSGSYGGNRKLRYHTALGSSGEVLAVYDTAEAMAYIDPVGSEVRSRVDHVIGTLVRVLGLRRSRARVCVSGCACVGVGGIFELSWLLKIFSR